MRPTTSRTTILVGLAALVALTVFFFVSVQRGAKVPSLSATINPEQKPAVAQLKEQILTRVQSKTPLTEQERSLISVIVTVPNYQFSPDELQLISEALKK